MSKHHTFGSAVMEARKNAGLTLREAARRMGLSPSYLSKIELDKTDPPSADVIRKLAALYGVPVQTLLVFAQERVRDVIGDEVRDNEGLFALYRVTNGMKPEEIFTLIGKLLNQLPPEEKERFEAKIKSQFPRLARGKSVLYAARVRPRILSKKQIRRMAETVLEEHGLTRETYRPPTPIEKIIEDTEGVHLFPSDSLEMRCERDGSPLVLGLTRWDIESRRLIEINESLYDTDDDRMRNRLNYTLAHEYWHAIEHLPLMDRQSQREGGLFRFNIDSRVLKEVTRPKWWEKKTKRRLETHEDWQEWQAQYFASEILMPHWSVRSEFERRFDAAEVASPDGYSQCEFADELAGKTLFSERIIRRPMHEVFAVSRQAMAIRLCELDLVQAPVARF
jgi:transcriptional regulator with XRE-family HTH domain/Zn-dependent peptidase ImmA (M78 family)